MKKTRMHLFALLLALLTLFALASCGAKDNAAGDYAPSGKGEAEMGNGLTGSASDASVSIPDTETRKIIKTYDIYSETKEYDAATEALKQLISDCGGYVESSSASDKSLNNTSANYSRYASYTIRIPAEQAEDFVGSVGNLFNVTSSNSYVEDISETYYSIQACLEELQAERDSLLDIMNAQDTKKDYSLWLTVNERLSDVKQQIAVYQGQLNRFDSKVSYSTVNLSIREVLNYSAVANSSFGSRIGNAFVNGWEDFGMGVQEFMIWFAGAIPVVILLAVLAVAVVFIIRAIRRKKKKFGKPTGSKDSQ